RAGDEQSEIPIGEREARLGAVVKELGCRALELAVGPLETNDAASTNTLRSRFDFVELLSRERSTSGNPNAAHAAALRNRVARDLERAIEAGHHEQLLVQLR